MTYIYKDTPVEMRSSSVRNSLADLKNSNFSTIKKSQRNLLFAIS